MIALALVVLVALGASVLLVLDALTVRRLRAELASVRTELDGARRAMDAAGVRRVERDGAPVSVQIDAIERARAKRKRRADRWLS